MTVLSVGYKTPSMVRFVREINELKNSLSTTNCRLAACIVENKIKHIQNEIYELCAENNAAKINKIIKGSSTTDGNFSQISYWKLKKSILPKEIDPPTAKKDAQGNLITSSRALKKLYLDTYINRLSPNPEEIEMEELNSLKEQLWIYRQKQLKQKKSRPWTMEELEKALSDLKSNKTRDPHGLLNEIFKKNFAGQNLKEGLLNLMNMIKDKIFIPSFFSLANITSIDKKKGSRLDMENQRGIFILTTF